MRRRRSYQRRGVNRRGCAFFVVSLLILIFAVGYFFFGDRFFSGDNLIAGDGEIIVSFLDVGQGDSIVIRSNTHAVLIDGGGRQTQSVVMNYLRDAGITRLDYVVATHPHSDHIGGLITVLGRMEVGTLLMPDVTHNTDTFRDFLMAIENNDVDVMFPVPGENIRAGIIDLLMVAPPENFYNDDDLNNHSIVLRMAHGQTSFLFTGDAEAASEQQMLLGGMNLSADVLKVGHHGSRTSTTEAFLQAVNPTYAVIQVGAGNQFGHPHSEVIDRLHIHGVTILRNDTHGTIRMITNGREIRAYD